MATLNVTPDRSQFFQYDRISLTCVANFSGWTVKRTVSSYTAQKCQHGWAIPSDNSCTIEDAYPADSGEYWCESDHGECSNKVNISVTASGVILESPWHPVEEGRNVTLRCIYKEEYNDKSTSHFSAHFYKNGVFIGTENPGEITFKAEEGFYKCRHPSKGESPESWLAVIAKKQPTEVPPIPPPGVSFPRVICGTILFIFYNFILILCIYTYRKWAKANVDVNKAKADLVGKMRRRSRGNGESYSM
ncbi:Fc receptor-like protein 5 [Cyprinodon tularosa]|uniref:Fc receptor-like protein 5 n=1 Tax=Cyprinodon tularosa TaxID=77115 RepID=UPI0018E1E032|nr:Fc receptor-like protein 5 [Cyprinodon tularosa]